MPTADIASLAIAAGPVTLAAQRLAMGPHRCSSSLVLVVPARVQAYPACEQHYRQWTGVTLTNLAFPLRVRQNGEHSRPSAGFRLRSKIINVETPVSSAAPLWGKYWRVRRRPLLARSTSPSSIATM